MGDTYKELQKNFKGRCNFGDLGIDTRIILKTGSKSVDWIHLDHIWSSDRLS
jgi:hypothetical protein